jgi:hypothetical protein
MILLQPVGTAARGGARAFAVLFVTLLAGLPNAARADEIALPELLRDAGTAVKVMMAGAEYDAAYADWERTRSEQGWKLAIGAGYGQERDMIDETRARDFEAIRTEVKLAYPLLGAYATQEREIEIAAGKVAEARIQRDNSLRIAQLYIEDVYAAFWGAQESLELIAAYNHASRNDANAGDSPAVRDQRRFARRRDDARARLEQLTNRKLVELVVAGLQLPKLPELASLRSMHASTRTQLDGSVWYGIDAGFDITQTTIQDRDGGQAGNGLFANFTVQLPATFFQAGLAERSKLRAEMRFIELKLRDKSEEIVAKAQGTEAEHLELADEVEATSRKTLAAAQGLRAEGRGTAASATREYYERALAEIDARTRFWRSHVAMRSFITVGDAEPAPEPTGPVSADVGTRLSEPLLRVAGD